MKKLLITFICLFIANCAYSAQIQFAQISDMNYSANNEMSSNILNWTVSSINLRKPDFVVFLGNNIKKSNETNLKEFLNNAKRIKTPYYIVTGNHDTYKLGGLEKDAYWKIIRKNNKYNKDFEKSYYSFKLNRNFICVVLDGAVPFAPTTHGIYSDEQLIWLDKTLKENRNKKVIIFQHFPIVEPEDKPSYTVLNKDKYEEVINKYDNIAIISSGHYDKSKMTTDEKNIYHISSPSIATPDYVYSIVTIDYKKLPFRKVKINDVSVIGIDLQ